MSTLDQKIFDILPQVYPERNSRGSMQSNDHSGVIANMTLAFLTLFALTMGISAAPPPAFRFAMSQGDNMVRVVGWYVDVRYV